MKKIKILITGVGAPGIQGTVFSLKNNYDNRDIYIIGTDSDNNVIGKFICDSFFQIPKATFKKDYIKVLKSIIKKEKVDIILPQNTSELLTLAELKDEFNKLGIKIIISSADSIHNANNKFELLKICKEISIPYPKYYLVNDKNGFKKALNTLGWPDKKVIVKPPLSNGSRGLRIIDEKINEKSLFFSEKPSKLFVKSNDLLRVMGDSFPELLITEYLPGTEYTVDIFRNNGSCTAIPRSRDLIKNGITFNGTVVKHDEIIKYSQDLADYLNLQYCFGFQFKDDLHGKPKILECNPRVQGTMVLSTLSNANLIYSSIKSALGEEIPEFNIKWGTQMFRYWGGISVYDNKIVNKI
jgi:carbamoyl-phosphate synthase large subunit